MARILIIASVLGLLSACTSDTSSTTDGAAGPEVAWQAFAQCARDNGHPDFPDPVFNAGGQVRFPGISLDITTYNELQSACGQFLSDLEGAGKDAPEASPEVVAAAQRFAECMREQGIRDWPDADPARAEEFFFPLEIWEDAKFGEGRVAVDACLPEFGDTFG
ncbi:MAG: hypothetical protein ACRD0K_01230 [Egibacteraceae bacterium]